MKLSEGWIFQFLTYKGDGSGYGKVATASEADGVMFLCPKCASAELNDDGKRSGHPVICWFAGKVPASASPGPGRWTFTGSTIDDLTLNPSVWLNGAGCGWHGWVRNGDAT